MWTFSPIYKTTLWGGERIPVLKGCSSAASQIGESWEISDLPGSVSVVDNGPDKGLTLNQLIERYDVDIMGKKGYDRYGTHFPLLVKIIDTTQWLSVQVHPDDDAASRLGLENGKSEMWYVMHAEQGARLIDGFSRKIDADELRRLLDEKNIESVLNYRAVSVGDVYYLPGGRVHSLGKGTMVVEIQQASDTTYRLYDYCRIDKNGNPRELHIDKALDVIDFDGLGGDEVEYSRIKNQPSRIIESPHFTVNIIDAVQNMVRYYSEVDSFVILVAVEGRARIETAKGSTLLAEGNTVLLSAREDEMRIYPDAGCRLLEVYLD